VLFAGLAVAALVWVNEPQLEANPAQAGNATPALQVMSSAVAATNEQSPPQRQAETPAEAELCADCGEITAIHVDAPQEVEGGAIEQAHVLEVRMQDGSQRLIRHSSPDFSVGDRVRVSENTLVGG
jgi:hypothetical protein